MNAAKKLLRAVCLCLALVIFITGCDTGGTADTTTTNSQTTEKNTTTGTTQTTSAPEPPKPTKKIALTFDDGPHNAHTRSIVDELAKYGAHATFFVVGNRVDGAAYRGGSTLAYVIQNGHEVGIHGYTHDVHYNDCTDEEYAYELGKTLEAIKGVSYDYETKLMRPIGGSITKERIASCEYAVITWSVDSEDWKHKYKSGDTDETRKEKVDTIVENVMSSVEEGSIVLMHDIYESTYDALVIILERLYAEGYEVVTVSELIGEPLPGTRYSKK